MTIESLGNRVRTVEALENYSLYADTKAEKYGDAKGASQPYSDEDFWRSFFRNPEGHWNARFSLYHVVISEWVARVPGLYWMPASEALRRVPDHEIEYREKTFRSERWVTYSPTGKSGKVLGGIGTFVLPPSDEGKKMMTASFSNNASTGIPVLVFPDVIDAHNLHQGDLIDIHEAVWRKLSNEWSNKFETGDSSIKRGCLVVDRPEQIRVIDRDHPIEMHPFTIMEYQVDNAILYDYVFCTIDNQFQEYRQEVEKFFANYSQRNQRNGKYLIAADSNDPLFPAEYNSPSDLLRNAAGGRSQLNLLTERIHGKFLYKGFTIQKLLNELAGRFITSNDVFAMAVEVNVPPGSIQNDAAAKMLVQLVDECLKRDRLKVLIDTILNPK